MDLLIMSRTIKSKFTHQFDKELFAELLEILINILIHDFLETLKQQRLKQLTLP